jgi:ketosteroid isomerase-like protein
VAGSNADVVRRAFDAFSRRDVEALLALADEEIEFRPATARVAGRGEPYRGHAGMRAYMSDVARIWQELRTEPSQLLEEGELVVVVGRVYAWGVGRVIDSPAGWVFRVRDGLLVYGAVFDTRREAMEAAGLSGEGAIMGGRRAHDEAS